MNQNNEMIIEKRGSNISNDNFKVCHRRCVCN